ncbi:pantoate--beta-alanine ligase [Thalassobaculum litoreum]|uniref:Pantothenate synthetase n=1 Tax=Thalassobaculum litoreum DSM 18839 TaxID=1123362 RepID=A0A8G2EXS4_9PROT|nr:pantoate--beta-alanine ligase [Thalassobaculum litoreum]SDF30802.1 pantothenate synthetase [Thalassobaculum litoreum DSM 18839]
MTQTPAPGAASRSPKDEPVVARTIADLRSLVAAWRRAGLSVGLVPTMGALHAGHLSLVAASQDVCDRTIVSIFVNPKQFAPGEDLDTYPRTWDSDLAALRDVGAHAVFAPIPSEVYPAGHATTVSVANLTDCLDGIARPGFFDGVATVVAKLFLQSGADKAFFGEKDFQQFLVVRRMAADLDIPIDVIGCPTVREADGLALSSRNTYLSAAERAQAPRLHQEMVKVAHRIRSGDGDISAACADAIAALSAEGFGPIDYIELRDAETLAALTGTDPVIRPARLFAAARLGETRLIDNIGV